MSMYAAHATDNKLEKSGVWVDYGDFRVKIAKAGGANRKYNQLVERAIKPHRRAIQAGTMTEERARPILVDVFAQTIVLGWETWDEKADKFVPGIEQPDGSIGEYSLENVKKVFNDLPAVFNMVKEDSTADDIFKAEVRKEEAGNSSKS